MNSRSEKVVEGGGAALPRAWSNRILPLFRKKDYSTTYILFLWSGLLFLREVVYREVYNTLIQTLFQPTCLFQWFIWTTKDVFKLYRTERYLLPYLRPMYHLTCILLVMKNCDSIHMRTDEWSIFNVEQILLKLIANSAGLMSCSRLMHLCCMISLIE